MAGLLHRDVHCGRQQGTDLSRVRSLLPQAAAACAAVFFIKRKKE